MILKWLPWKFIASRLARRHGFLDPIGLLAKLQSFAQPSEVDAPVELLRAGMVLHARGLINTKVIQQNLDWVWPYWVQRQFDPTDPSFLPRAFSITHINLTHRNWTAVGLPGCEAMPIVDPRGMLTPFFDGWSLDAWILPDDGPPLFPSHAPDDAVEQTFLTGGEPAISTRIRQAGMELRSHAQVVEDGSQIVCRLDCAAATDTPGWLAIAVRPFNPEGVSFISRLHHDDGTHLRINRASCVTFSRGIERCLTSNYQRGDVAVSASRTHDSESQECDVGLCTAAALFRIGSDMSTNVSVDVSLADDNNSTPLLPTGRTTTWPAATRDTCMLDVPDERFVRLYDQAKHTLVLLSPKDPYPGPFTYKRFWFRDATYLLHAMLCLGLTDRAQAALAHFEQRQTMTGFFHSQQGEWDSNGQVLWLLRRFVELTGRRLSSHWTKPIRKAVHWIHRKRLPVGKGELRDGLMPAGFSAEHLGNNDYYYWDDYWSVAGLRAADVLMADAGEEVDAAGCRREASDLLDAIDESLIRSRNIRGTQAIPASPDRRMDAGAVGSLVASYPLGLVAPDDPRLIGTAEWLAENCLVKGAFFQDMIHSGMNPYLTLHLAQVFLRASRSEYWSLVQAVADLASPTGQWPEAVHPRTGGGCMGDGQHGWAAADWTLMMRSLFVREEGSRLILGSGIPCQWIESGRAMCFGPTPTRFGDVTVRIQPAGSEATVTWDAPWREPPERVDVMLPAFAPATVSASDQRTVTVDQDSRSKSDGEGGPCS